MMKTVSPLCRKKLFIVVARTQDTVRVKGNAAIINALKIHIKPKFGHT